MHGGVGSQVNNALQSEVGPNSCNPITHTQSNPKKSYASSDNSLSVHYGPLPPPLANFAVNPKSSLPKSAYSIVVGNAWELLAEVDEFLQEKPDEGQQAIPIESLFDPEALKKLSYCYISPPNTRFVSSHQISELFGGRKSPSSNT